MPRQCSPLRYPGGKACLLPAAVEILKLNDLERHHYVEPYAGGCGLALSLLFGGFVSDIHINDVDPAIWCFWHSVLERTEDLIDLVESAPLTIAEWRRQGAILEANDASDPVRLGFAAFYLNRTNRSGVIKNAGVIGGLQQSGNYKMDCRFNRERLAKRIARISKYSDRIHLYRMDAVDFMQSTDTFPADAFLCIDPPYFKKGASLYTSFYEPEDHAAVAEAVLGLENPWIVTYDYVSSISDLYRERRQFSFGINYSLNEKRIGTELLIASKGLRLPSEVRSNQVRQVQYRSAPTT